MSDHTQVGVPVWIGPNGGAIVNPTPHYDATHLAIPLDTESLARLRERVRWALAVAMDGVSMPDYKFNATIDAVLAALGLDPS